MVNLLLLRPKSAMATILLSCFVATSFVVLATESVRAGSVAATAAQDPRRMLSKLSSPSEDQPSLFERGITITPLTRPASLPYLQDEEDGERPLQLQRQRYQQQQQQQKQNQLYDIQPVFVVDQTEFDVYLGTYPDKRPRPLNASAKRRKKKKKKKKKVVIEGQEVVQEEVPPPPPVQGRQYTGPAYEQRSVPGFRMAAIEAPWRYRMSYTLDWTVNPDLRELIEEGLTSAEARRLEQARRYEASTTTHLGASENDEGILGPAVVEQRLRIGSELVMDFQLIPLDHVKSNELLLTRVPVSSLQAHIQLRPEVLEGWYRLQIQFWEEPDPSSPDCDLFSSSSSLLNNDDSDKDDKDWEENTDSILLSSPGRLKEGMWAHNCFPRQVGIWRSAEAIEVTRLEPQDLEWDEFIETLSRETRQERWSLSEFSTSKLTEHTSREQQKAILREEHLAIEEFREPRPVVVKGDGDSGGRWGWGLGRLSGIRQRIKGFLANPPWRNNSNSNSNKAATSTESGASSSAIGAELPGLSPSSSSTPPAPSLWRRQEKRMYERTIFPQDSFRYQEFVGPNIKDVIPDFLLQELEEFEDATMDALEAQQERVEQQKKQLKEVVRNEEGAVEEESVVIYPMSVWDPEIERLQELMDVWNAGPLLRKRYGDVDSSDSVEEESEEAVADQNDNDKGEEEPILEVEGGRGRAKRGLNPRIWQGAIETDSQVPVTWRSNRDRIISWRIPPQLPLQTTLLLDIELVASPVHSEGQQMGWTRETITQAALEQQPAVTVLTDRVPVTWKAVQVTMPAWVPVGMYHIRIQGVNDVAGAGRGDGGVVVEDISQP
ncbi:hypothetical protein BG015_000699, partial [Linnemannia schmuckeri]